MAKNLLIVESPAKAKTIEKILGTDFSVKSCFGHIRDLPKKGMGIDIENGFMPNYEISPDKKDIVKELQKLAKDAEVWLATDEDREGEAISWHLCEVLGLDSKKTKRIVFNEITESAIKNAVQKPRLLNENLVNAQQARRILDRLVGFELSPVLWKKLNRPTLSAGRVQSVAVRLVAEREREINAFKSDFQYKTSGVFTVKDNGKDKSFRADLNEKFDKVEQAETFVNACKGAIYTVNNIQVKPAFRSPAAPFTTSTLQQEASRKLGFSVKKTMMVAQKLYESGKITYMRTDSPNLSELAINTIRSLVTEKYGVGFSNPKQYASKNASAQEAHEAIRPSYVQNETVDGPNDEVRLYDLIWKRTVASQMSNAKLEKTIVNIGISTRSEEFVAEGEVIKFEGFLKVYLESNDDENDEDEETGILPSFAIGQNPNNISITATQKFSKPPGRFTEASLVKKLEELGIGRPSTFAPTISTIIDRGYVERGQREGQFRAYVQIVLKGNDISKNTLQETTGAVKGQLIPTDIGLLVNDFLTDQFKEVLNYSFTANIEKEFDTIASGNLEWGKMLAGFYKPFHEEVEKSINNKERVTGERALGTDPKTGKNMIARMGKFGPMIQIGDSEGDEKPTYAKLMPGQSIETITHEEAIKLFDLPRVVGVFEEKEIKANNGRFGPYVQHGSLFVSLKKEDNVLTVTEERAIELIQEKRIADINKFIQEFPEQGIQVLNGRFGPYLKQGKNNFKIPKGRDPKILTLEECLELIASGGKDAPKKGAPAKKSAPATKKKAAVPKKK